MLKSLVQNGKAPWEYEAVFKRAYLFVIRIHLLETKNWVQIFDVELGFQLIWLTQAIKILYKEGVPLSLKYCNLALILLSSERHVWDHKYSVVSRETLHGKFTVDEKYHAASTQNNFLHDMSSTITLLVSVPKLIHTGNVCYFLWWL